MAKYHVYRGEGDVQYLEAADRPAALAAFAKTPGADATLWEFSGQVGRLVAGRMSSSALIVGTPESTAFVSKLPEAPS